MKLKYKPDWEETQERFKMWWAREDFGRCALTIGAPKDNVEPMEKPVFKGKPEDAEYDVEYNQKLADFYNYRNFYGVENVPATMAGIMAADSVASYLGCPVKVEGITGWVYPVMEEGTLTDYDYKDYELKPDNEYWSTIGERTKRKVDMLKGRCIFGTLPILGVGDTLAAMRGTQQLLFDLVDCPEYVRDFEIHLMKKWIEVYDYLYNITSVATEGSYGWLPVWAPGKMFPVQNDFSYMISTKMYEDIFLPALEMQLEYLDYSIYHLDGAAAFRHLDMLLSLPKLNAIQLFPGEKQPSPRYFMEQLKKIQAAGKNIQIELPPEDIRPVLEELSCVGLMISTSCRTEAEALEIIKIAEKYSKAR